MTCIWQWRPSLKQANDKTKRALGLLGLAARAGRTVVGVPLICTALQRAAKDKTPLLVVVAADCSANSNKRIMDRTAYYGVRAVKTDIDCEALALAVGKRDALVAAVGVTEQNLAAQIARVLDE